MRTLGNRIISENPLTLKVHPMRAKNMVNILPPSVFGDRSPKPTVHIVTEDCVEEMKSREKGVGRGEIKSRKKAE